MLDRRSLFGVLIVFSICLSIWRISVQESSIVTSNEWSILDAMHLKHQTIKEKPDNSSHQHLFRKLYQNFGSIESSENDINGWHSNDVNVTNHYQVNDEERLINLTNFKFIINQSPCLKPSKLPNVNLLILILVHSAPQNRLKRLLIRETWGSFQSTQYRLIFLLGNVSNEMQQKKILLENKIFGDIVQGNFHDAYRNMTYKHVMALKWFTYNCINVPYLLKIDDDIFVNTPELLKFLQKIENNEIIQIYHDGKNRAIRNHDLLFCLKTSFALIKRTYRSKWRVSYKEYPGKYYPTYCPGYAIVYSADIVIKLYMLAQKSNYFWIDDIHITGTMAKLANITITPFQQFVITEYAFNKLVRDLDLLTADINEFDSNNSNAKQQQIFQSRLSSFLFSWENVVKKDIRRLWNFVEFKLKNDVS